MAVKEGQLSAGRDEFRLVMAVWVGLVQAGRVTFRYGGLRQGGLGSIRSVWVRHVAVRYVAAVKVIRVTLSHGVFRSVKLRQPRWGIMQIPRHILTLVGEEDGRQN